MGKPERNSIATVIAVLVVGLLLLVVVLGSAGALVGWLLYESYGTDAQFATVESQLTEVVDNGLIQIDAAGQITLDGVACSIDELRSILQQSPQEGTPLIFADPNCPEDVLTEVSSLHEEVFGSSPDIMTIEAN